MVAISIMIEGQEGLTWSRWKELVTEVEGLGFAGLFRSDHFARPSPPDQDALELIVALTYLAAHTRRIHFGPLVAPLSFRDPSLLARQAAALDDLSGGRMILGIGAGWMTREHEMFGYDLGDVTTRVARLEEGLEIITQLLRNDGPSSYEGQFFQLREAILLPRPSRGGGPPILIGGSGPKKILPLVARFGDLWNAHGLSPTEFRQRSTLLDQWLGKVGRQPADVKRTLMLTVVCGRASELERSLRWFRQSDGFGNLPTAQLVQAVRERFHAIVGTPDEVIQQIHEYADAGVEELMIQWWDQDDLEGLRALAESLLPRLPA